LDKRITDIGAEIERLRAQLRELQDGLTSLDGIEAQTEQVHTQRQRQAVLDALNNSFEHLEETHDHWVGVVNFLQRRKEILDTNPDFPRLLNDFRAFNPESKAITGLPQTHRESLLKAQRQLEKQLHPYLQLEAELEELALEDPVTLRIVGFHNVEKDCFLWVLPYHDSQDLTGEVRNALNDVVWEIAYQILNLGQEPDWTLDEASVDSWEGYDALVMEGSYTGTNSIAEAVMRHLESQLPTRPLFRSAVPNVEVVILPYAVLTAKPQPEPEWTRRGTVLEATDRVGGPLIEITGGWYSASDVKSWEAPLNVVEESLWNVQARRLRTVLIRMIARGHLEDQGVPLRVLHRNVPAPHSGSLVAGLQRLRDAGVLQERVTSEDDQTLVTLDPTHLQEIQNLINREVTPFWAGIVASEGDGKRGNDARGAFSW
jgi:hypothetical protein